MRSALCLALAVCGLAAATARAASPSPRIVNGSSTLAYPSTGALLVENPDDPTQLDGLCSGTLIGCRSFLTAAHCVCPAESDDAAGCLALGLRDPATLRVFLPHAGFLAVDSAAISPEYTFAVKGDAAVLHLAAGGTAGVAPATINTRGRVAAGTRGTIVGYGSTGGPSFLPSDYGVKRVGEVTTGSCPEEIPTDTHVCWNYDGSDASTCSGDSGGPLFVRDGDGFVLAGLVSGSEDFACRPPDQVFTTDVFVQREWIAGEMDGDSAGACSDLPAIGEDGAVTRGTSLALSATRAESGFDFTVPAGARLLRVGLNGQEVGGSGPFRAMNDFDLFVRAGLPPEGEAFDCGDTTPGVFAACEFRAPAPGEWHVLVTRVAGEGTAQLTVSTFVGTGALRGDANCDRYLGAADLVALARLVGAAAPPPCEDADANGDGVIDAADLPPMLAAIFALF